MNNNWIGIMGGKYKYHFVCPQCVDRHIEMWRGEDVGELVLAPRDMAVVDMPGAILADRKMWTVRVGANLKLQMPVVDFEVFFAAMKKAVAAKYEDGTEYYTLEGWMQAVVMTPMMRDNLLGAMYGAREHVRTDARLERERLEKAVTNLQKSGGLADPDPDDGPIGGSWN